VNQQIFPFPTEKEIPDIGFYMDQVITYMSRYAPEKPLTKTMINNYTKDRILFPPKKKKYSKEHLMLLFLLQVLKTTLPLPKIKEFLGPLSISAEQGNTEPLHNLYNMLVELSPAIIELAENTAAKARDLGKQGSGMPLIYSTLSGFMAQHASQSIFELDL
jgi:DNA-binding transcriptional MerR regulator